MRVAQRAGIMTRRGFRNRRASLRIGATPSDEPIVPISSETQTSTCSGRSTSVDSPWISVMRSARPFGRDQILRARERVLQRTSIA